MSSEAPSLGGAAGSAEQPRLRWLREVWNSTLGKKIIVAITGVVLAAYVILHALGNLKALQGPNGQGIASIDEYAEFLRDAGGPVVPASGLLWAVRIVLITAFVIHVVGVSQLIKRNRAARPDGNPPVIQRSLRLPDDGRERVHPARVHRLPRPPVHDADDPPDAAGRGRGLREPLRRVPGVVAGRALRRGDGRPLLPPAPRPLEPPADARAGEAESQPELPPRRDR